MNLLTKIFFTVVLFLTAATCFSMENLFYTLRSNAPTHISTAKSSLSSITTHYNSINILVSQAYQIDENGVLWGFIDPDVFNFAKTHSMKLMAMITNAGFNKEKTHNFLANPNAQKKALQSIIDACDQNHFYGIQLDFEMVPLEDRDALTRFYQTAADMLHKKGYAISFAVAPLLTDGPITSEFQKRIYENWEGAYDFKALGDCSDFMTIMAYNQHGDITTPGPTASIRWVEQVVKYALRYVPAQKVSLGIPTYSGYWYTGLTEESPKKIVPRLTAIGYDKVNYLLQKFHTNLQWDDVNKNNFASFDHDWLNEYIFAEDAKSFKAKLEVAKKYNLRGISVFYIGIEDPQIWNVLAGRA